jgi:phenylalanyl-tRNA synthetase alpha chain
MSGNYPILEKYQINIQELENELNADLNNSSTEEALTIVWRKFLGKEGKISELLKKIKDVDNQDRKDFGQAVNTIKDIFDTNINSAKEAIKNKVGAEYLNIQQVKIDNLKPKIGHIHPLTQTTNDLNEIFRRLGYSIMDGPEIESDEYCFQRLNVPLDHPARDLQDSIYIEEPNILLRTQTSSIEARVLEQYKPPFKVVMPGRVYRNEKVNKSNHFTFHQYQLTVVKEKVSMAELFATINNLFKSYYGEDVEIRFRCKYYPEVEPGVGPDMKCFNCKGSGKKDNDRCGVCKGRGWMEMGGAGIIHPKVLQMAGLDPQKWQGYAFGMGLDRWAMAKHNITDIRTLLGGNLAYKPNIN